MWIILTAPHEENALKSDLSEKGLKSFISISNLKSGLSVPYFSIASLYGWIGKSFRSTLIISLNTLTIKFWTKFLTSSSSTKLISKSIWVNSGWRSDLKSSSLKHLTIWKYLSKPEIINSCLYICGDCGKA